MEYAPPTPLTGPHALSRLGALRHWLGAGRARARVYVLNDGAARVLRRGERPAMRTALGQRCRAVYYLDEDTHTTDVECELPSAEAGRQFSARLRLIWWVHDVERVVQARVGDVRQALVPFLESYLGRVSREYALTAVGGAEDRLRREIAGDLPLDVGLTVRSLTLSLRPDEAVATLDDRLAELHRELMIEEARGQLEVLRARNEVAAWQVRLAFYRSVVEAGMPSVLALRLMVDPSSAGEVAGVADNPAALPEGGPRPASQNGSTDHLTAQ